MANNIIKPEMLTQNKAKFLKLISNCDNSDLTIGKGSYKLIMRIKLHCEHLILSKSIYEKGKNTKSIILVILAFRNLTGINYLQLLCYSITSLAPICNNN